ncbi:MAG: hypothetical protein GQ557_00930 [Mycoplasmataceae bacterium]|nr:hypothetical protein [Mycoplasmataceae bacterium]
MKKNNSKEEMAMLPGSFNPMHIGHEHLIRIASLDYKKVYVVVAINDGKRYDVSLSNRYELVKKFVNHECFENVTVLRLDPGKTIPALAKELNVTNIVRGTQIQSIDMEESSLADNYLEDNENLSFHYIKFSDLNLTSSMVREKLVHRDDISDLVPPIIEEDIKRLWTKGI